MGTGWNVMCGSKRKVSERECEIRGASSVCSHRRLKVSRRYQDTLRHHHPPHGRPGALPAHAHSHPAAISIPSQCAVPVHPATAIPVSALDKSHTPTPHTASIQSSTETHTSAPQRPLSQVPYDATVSAVSQWPDTNPSTFILRLRSPAFKPYSYHADNAAGRHVTHQLDPVHHQHEQATAAIQWTQSSG